MSVNHQRIKRLANSKGFIHSVNYAILSFAFLVGIESLIPGHEWRLTFRIIDYFYLAFFTFEIVLRILAEDHPGLYFKLFTVETERGEDGKTRKRIRFTEHGFWNYFDFALILISIIGLSAQLFFMPGFIQVGRLFRIFRIIRLLEISEHLKQVEQRIMSIVPTVFSFAILLMILNYIYAILGIFMFGTRQYASCDFHTLPSAFITLFQIMTLDNWSDVMHDLSANSPFHPYVIQFYFVSFVVFTSIIAFNVFVAVMTSQVQNKMEADIDKKVAETQIKDEITHDRLREAMKDVLEELQSLRREVKEMKK